MGSGAVCSHDFYIYQSQHPFEFYGTVSSLDTIHTGAPYDRIGSIAPLYIILRTSCLNPQLILADLVHEYSLCFSL